MKRIIIFAAALVCTLSLRAQTMDEVVAAVEQGSTYLEALRNQTEAECLGNRTDIYLSGPEVEFHYLWGNLEGMGQRADIAVRQSFDLATLFGYRRRVANSQNNLLSLDYKAERIATVLQAKRLYINLVYNNALRDAVAERLAYAEQIAAGYEQALTQGTANVLEYNKAMLNLATVRGELTRIDVALDQLHAELATLAGGDTLRVSATEFPLQSIPDNFEEWYAECERTNPVMEYARGEVELGRDRVRLSKAANLPDIAAGYMHENMRGEGYHGVTVGLSIPLWSTRNKTRQARAAQLAAETRAEDTRVRFYNDVSSRYHLSLGLRTTAEEYRRALGDTDNQALLKQAFEQGAISLLDYILESQLYLDALQRTLEAERDYSLSAAELSAYAM